MKWQNVLQKRSNWLLLCLGVLSCTFWPSKKITAGFSDKGRSAVFFSTHTNLHDVDFTHLLIALEDSLSYKKTRVRKKATAVLLAVALGPFGVHRLYLGTHPRVPVVYSLTLGGVGLIPLADIVAILATKDIRVYEDNPRVFMWLK